MSDTTFDLAAYTELEAKFNAALGDPANGVAPDVPTILALSAPYNKARREKERAEYESRSGERMALAIKIRDAITEVVKPFVPGLLGLQSDAKVVYTWADFSAIPTIACFKAKPSEAKSDGTKTMPALADQKRDARKTSDLLDELGDHVVVEADGKGTKFAEGLTISAAHAKYHDNNKRHQLRKLLLKLADAPDAPVEDEAAE